MEEFDFKPMTDGLGFDKHAEEVKHSVIESSARPAKPLPQPTQVSEIKPEDDQIVSRSIKKMLDTLPPSLDWAEDTQKARDFKAPKIPPAPAPPISTPTPPEAFKKPAPVIEKPKASFDVTLNNSISAAFPKTEFTKPFYHQTVTPKVQFQEIPASFSSAIIDGLVAMGLTGLFVVTLIVLTGVDVFSFSASRELLMRTGIEIFALYWGVLLVYYVLARSLYGSTLGDWAFDVQLGTAEERVHGMYPFQVFFRLLVILVTGVIFVPLASMGFRKDLAKKFSGLSLYCRQF